MDFDRPATSEAKAKKGNQELYNPTAGVWCADGAAYNFGMNSKPIGSDIWGIRITAMDL